MCFSEFSDAEFGVIFEEICVNCSNMNSLDKEEQKNMVKCDRLVHMRTLSQSQHALDGRQLGKDKNRQTRSHKIRPGPSCCVSPQTEAARLTWPKVEAQDEHTLCLSRHRAQTVR